MALQSRLYSHLKFKLFCSSVIGWIQINKNQLYNEVPSKKSLPTRISLPGTSVETVFDDGVRLNSIHRRLRCSSRTHVDDSGHVYDHNIDVGFDVDTRHLHVLKDSELIPPRWDVYDKGKIYDIRHRITAATPTGISQTGIGEYYLRLHDSMRIFMSIWLIGLAAATVGLSICTRLRRITARGKCRIEEYWKTTQNVHLIMSITCFPAIGFAQRTQNSYSTT
uniref:Uncharacterized protein n=1 Tax=Helianthus annuus TaxID=4232 RepID=A0A251TVC7_HELAN